MTTIRDALAGVSRLGVDTAPVIYFIEGNPHFDDTVRSVFEHFGQANLTDITSVITLAEVLVQTHARQDKHLQDHYREILLRSNDFQTLPIDPAAADRAAEWRARYHLRLPDALQLAVALNAGCEAFLTNDRVFQHVTDLRVLILADLST
ncbi:MAG TPA: PIN domain-containing protein [Chloroflexota bacterium]|nr:PIN domain-containing protein [Chloroflexota bacterium]